MPPHGKRGRGRGRADGAHSAPAPHSGPPAPHSGPPAPRPVGAARFTPSSAYLDHHASPAPLGPAGPGQPPLGVPPAPQDVLEGVLAWLQPVPTPPPSFPADRPAPLPPLQSPYTANYYGTHTPAAPGPSRSAWPPPLAQHPVAAPRAYSRTPSVLSTNLASAPSSARPTPPAVYPPPPQPLAYTRAAAPTSGHHVALTPPAYRVPPTSTPYLPPPASTPASLPPPATSSTAPTRGESPHTIDPSPLAAMPPTLQHTPSRAHATPAPPLPADVSTAPAPASPAPLSALPAALRAQATATPISAAHDLVSLPPPSSPAKPVPSSSSDSSSTSSNSSSDEDSSEDASDSDDEERVASALVGSRRSGENAQPAPPAKPAGSADSSSSSSSSSSDSSSSDISDDESVAGTAHDRERDDDGADSDAISNLEEAVQEMVDEEDDDEHALHAVELPFDLGSASEADAGADDEDVPDDSLEHLPSRKRRRPDLTGLGSPTALPEDEDDGASSRAVSLDPAAPDDENEDAPAPPKRARLASPSQPPSPPPASASAVSQASSSVPSRAPALAGHAFATSTPTRLSSVHTAPAPSSRIAPECDLLLPPQDEEDELEEGELPVEDEPAARHAYSSFPPAPAAAFSSYYSPTLAARPASASSALPLAAGPVYHPALPIGGAAGQVQLAVPGRAGEITVSGVSAVAGDDDQSMDMDMSFADLPAELLADLSRRAGGAISIAVPPPPVSKATYERRTTGAPTLDLSSTPVASGSGRGVVVHNKPAKLLYKPSPLARAPVAFVDPAAPMPAPSKGVYVRRQPVSTVSTDTTPTPTPVPVAAPPPAKAVYERRANAPSSKVAKPRAKATKPGKPSGQLPLSQEEKFERLPPKIYKAFGDFPSLESAADPAIFAVPHHTVLPGRNLPPPNELCTHGFWPGPPALKLGKAIFPAPPEPLEDAADDARPRVDVFIDNSNVVYSFLNWVRARPEAKIASKVQPAGGKGKDGGAMSKIKTVKVVTIGGKKVRLDYRALFALLERGRKIERRVLVGSSTLWQTLEPAVEWGYEISLLQRVPRAEPSTSAATIAQVAQAAAANAPGSKKRGKNGKLKKPPPPPPPVIVQPQASGVKHYKEQAVDELVHLKILETLLDYTPDPLPPPSPPRRAAAPPLAPASAPSAASAPVDVQSESAPSRAVSAVPELATEPPVEPSVPPMHAAAHEVPPLTEGIIAEPTRAGVQPAASSESAADQTLPVASSADEASAPVEAIVEDVGSQEVSVSGDMNVHAGGAEDVEMGEVAELEAALQANESLEPHAEDAHDAAKTDGEAGGSESAADALGASASAAASPEVAAALADVDTHADGTAALESEHRAASIASPADEASAAEPAPDSAALTPASDSATPRFLPSKAFLSGSVQPAKPVAVPAIPATIVKPAAGPSKFTPAAPKPKNAPVVVTRIATAPPKPAFAPRTTRSDRPTLVIVTGDANSSEYNPGGFLGCVRRALDRGWDVEVVAFTHGISSLWTAEQQVKVTSDGRRRGELRVVDLAQFGEELVL